MMRTILGLALFTATSLHAATPRLAVDSDLLLEAGELIHQQSSSSSSPALPILQLAAAQKTGGGPPAGPPMLSGVGLGIQLGMPTALTLKLGGAHENGFAFGLGAGFGYGRAFLPSLSLHGDYQLHLATLVRNGDLSLTGYVAPGLWLVLFGTGYGFYNGPAYAPGINFAGLGVRLSLGLSMAFSAAPIELYLELTPAVFVFPGFDAGIGWTFGFRYFF